MQRPRCNTALGVQGGQGKCKHPAKIYQQRRDEARSDSECVSLREGCREYSSCFPPSLHLETVRTEVRTRLLNLQLGTCEAEGVKDDVFSSRVSRHVYKMRSESLGLAVH